jgi:hypothetical protein
MVHDVGSTECRLSPAKSPIILGAEMSQW